MPAMQLDEATVQKKSAVKKKRGNTSVALFCLHSSCTSPWRDNWPLYSRLPMINHNKHCKNVIQRVFLRKECISYIWQTHTKYCKKHYLDKVCFKIHLDKS